MTTNRTVAVIVGSLRKASFNRKIAQLLAVLAPENLQLEIVEIGQLPLYNEDDEPSPPAQWAAFRERISRFDAVIFVTPEYNRGVPAALKNAIDVGTRPWGKNVWTGKPTAVASSSLGSLGGYGAHCHVRQTLGPLGVPVMPTPEIYIGAVNNVFNDKGELTNDNVRKLLQTFIDSFAVWIEKVR